MEDYCFTQMSCPAQAMVIIGHYGKKSPSNVKDFNSINVVSQATLLKRDL